MLPVTNFQKNHQSACHSGKRNCDATTAMELSLHTHCASNNRLLRHSTEPLFSGFEPDIVFHVFVLVKYMQRASSTLHVVLVKKGEHHEIKSMHKPRKKVGLIYCSCILSCFPLLNAAQKMLSIHFSFGFKYKLP